MEWDSWEELENSGELEGYDYYWSHDIDYTVCTETPCEKCGGQCRYEGRCDEKNTSRRSFSICQDCGRVVEF